MACLDGLETEQDLRNDLLYNSLILVCSGTAWSWVTDPCDVQARAVVIKHELVPLKQQRKIQTVFLTTRC